MHQELIAQGHVCNRKTVAKCMQAAGIQAKTVKRFKVTTTNSAHHHPVAENIVDRNFTVNEEPDLGGRHHLYSDC
ncbi:MAG: transposase [Planctomycetaceae bacterium]